MSSDVLHDGATASAYLREVIARHREGALDRSDLFWSTSPRPHSDACREVFQVEFAGPRPVNHISFRAARFPHNIRGEWWDPARNEWRPLRQQIGAITDIDPAYNIAEQREKWEGEPVYSEITDSRPARVGSYSSNQLQATHPHHYGTAHWVHISWKVVPVQAKAIRLILVRHMQGVFPVGPDGVQAPYSLAIKDFSAGFRVYSLGDIPASGRVTMEEFGSSADLMGTPITYRLKENSPRHVLGSGVEGKFWKSEPQPVNYAVVNFYVDMRDASGKGQTIDRFYLDPLTVGPTLNVYYTSDDPDSDFTADDTALTYPIASPHGDALERESDPLGNYADRIIFSDTGSAFVDVSNEFLQWDIDRPWWLGMAVTPSSHEGLHPWASFGGNTLRQSGSDVEFVTSDGISLKVPIPEALSPGTPVNVALAWTPEGYTDGEFNPHTITLFVGSPGVEHNWETLDVLPTSLGDRPEVFSVGRYPVFSTPGVPAFALRGLTLKVDELPPIGFLEGFLSDPDLFVLKPEFSQAPDLSVNSLLRMHPRFATPANVSGSVGGPGDRYDDVEWTPVSRDFILRQGFLRIPPTRAKHFKFEFTNLVHETYESFIPIRREVLVFPTSVVQEYRYRHPEPIEKSYPGRSLYEDGNIGVGLHDYSASPGLRTMMENSDLARYSDAISLMNRQHQVAAEGRRSGTEGYVAQDPESQAKLADTGWIWSYTPWHIGSSAPRFTLTQKHSYEKVTVSHETKTAFFVGLRRLDAYRVDYATDDDTDIYYEHFLDEANLMASDGIIFTDEGMQALASGSVMTSQVFPSTRNVRGLQFATVQSDNIAILPDDGFVSESPQDHWAVYGDATYSRVPGQGLRVNRGWYQRTYGLIEAEFPTYEDLEGMTYGEIEGATAFGVAGGGVESVQVSPSASGRIYAAARVSAPDEALAGPIRLEIVSVDTGDVLAAEERHLARGETAILRAAYSVGTAEVPVTYGDLEQYTYGELDGQRYTDLQSDPIRGEVFARLWQTNPSQDSFMVHRLSIFDSPVAWRFSVDGGGTWADPLDIRNNPEGVLTFPTHGNALAWRATIYDPDAAVSALAIRPWYGGLLGSVTRSETHYVGPNRSVIDDYPDVDDDPLWRQSHDPIPGWWYTRDVASPVGSAPNRPVDGDIVVPAPPVDETISPPVDPEI